MAKSPETEQHPYGHTFRIIRENAGFLGLGVEISVVENGILSEPTIVYGDALHSVKLHMAAEVIWLLTRSGEEEILMTNERLPEELRRPHPGFLKDSDA
jgi:hypothetical protein